MFLIRISTIISYVKFTPVTLAHTERVCAFADVIYIMCYCCEHGGIALAGSKEGLTKDAPIDLTVDGCEQKKDLLPGRETFFEPEPEHWVDEPFDDWSSYPRTDEWERVDNPNYQYTPLTPWPWWYKRECKRCDVDCCVVPRRLFQ